MAAVTLDALPLEIITQILFSLPAISTVQALILTSRRFYDAFAPAKLEILRQVLHNELGLVLRDAIYRENQDGLEFYPDEDGSVLAEASAQYTRILSSATPSDLIKDASYGLLIGVIRRLRLLHNILDLITAPILAELKLIDESAAQPLSTAETQRFLQALFRYSILTRYDNDSTSAEPYETSTHENPCVSMFSPWELQQISDINCYLSNIWYTLLYSGKCGGLGRNIEERSVKETNLTLLYAYDLERLWNKIEDSVSNDPSFAAVLADKIAHEDMRGGLVRIVTSCNSHSLDNSAAPGRTTESGDATAIADTGNVASPPFAWADALDGRAWQRWGFELLEPPLETNSSAEYQFNEKRIFSWRRFGFMFWDKERVARLKQTTAFASFKTGWIVHAWDRGDSDS